MQTTNKNFTDVLGGSSGIGRRDFLKYTGMGLASAALIANAESCKKDNNSSGNPKNGPSVTFASGDTGILQYAYALEQLEAAFYTKVLTGSYFLGLSSSSAERQVLVDIQMHEVCHRDFFKTALGSSALIGLTPYFNNINFNDRTSVLTTAKTFEDLGVSAYNGVASFLSDVNNLLVAGKIVSVEARHASALRDLLSPNSSSFAGDDVVSVTPPNVGLDQANTCTYVLGQAGAYVTNTFITSNLPS